MAIVSQLCISFPYVLHGLCEDYLTCDIAFNAVMPLSHASTRGRYSRIEGVTNYSLVVEQFDIWGFDYMGLCEDYLTCDIAFDALMPLSRASTRRRYSRIEGVTSW